MNRKRKKDNGVTCVLYGCKRRQHARGICKKHTHEFIREETFEFYANPAKLLKEYCRKKVARGIVCVIEGCHALRLTRGICAGHISTLKKRGLYNKLALPVKPKVIYKLKKIINKNLCRIQGCSNKPLVRGLCSGHVSSVKKACLYETLAAPDKKTYYAQNEYRIKKRVPKGKCRIVENDKGCKNDVHQRGLCSKHCSIFRLYKVYEDYASEL